MIRIPAAVQSQYDEFLVRSGVPSRQHVDYRKWLRYYWDFCGKYGHHRLARATLPLFTAKLASRRQSEEKRVQASHAVEMYWAMLRVQRDNGYTDAGGSVRSMPTERTPVTDVSAPVPPQIPAGAPAADSYAGLEVRESTVSPLDRRGHADGTVGGASWVREYDELRNAIRMRNYSPRTFQTYRHWMRRLQGFTGSKAPAELGTEDVKDFLTYLAVEEKVAASTQNQAFNALLFFFRHVLGREFGKVDGIVRAKKRPYIPVVLSRDEVDRILPRLEPPYDLVVKLLYGCGLRISECMNIRVHWLNLDERILTIHDGKGQKDRTVPLPESLVPEIRRRLEQVWQLHQNDLKARYSGVFLPSQLERKYRNAAKEYIWQWLFAARRLSRVAATGEFRRYHMQNKEVHRALKRAVARCALTKRVTPHTFRHTFASHLLQANYDIRTIQKLLGHSDVKTTMIYTHTVPSRTKKEIRSPLDFRND